jgi:histidinol-phosphate aminotransferase
MSYVSGKSADALRREFGLASVVKLGSNESPLGPSARVLAAMAESAPQASVYPGVEELDLRSDIAAQTGLAVASVVVGNGSCDVLVRAAGAWLHPGDEAIVPGPAFAMYRVAIERAGGTVVDVPHRDYAVDQEGIRAAVTPRTRMLFLANPNNPTGFALSREELTALLDDLPPDLLILLDEAYGEFVDPELHVDGVDFLRAGRNVLVTRTFSKIHALAGLRVGYGLAAPALADRLRATQLPFHTGGLALRAARVALSDTEHLELSRRVNREGRSYLTAELRGMGLQVLSSQANHVLIVGLADVESLEVNLNRQGVIARPTGPSFGLEGGLRVTVGTREMNDAFLAALRSALGR